MEASANPIKSIVNSNNLYQATKSTKSLVDIAQIQKCVKESKVQIFWVKTDDMLADCMTKRGGKTDGLVDMITPGVLPSIKEANKAGIYLVSYTAEDIDKDIAEDIDEDIAEDIDKDIAKDIGEDINKDIGY